jgi:hypothetical protein
VTVALAELAVSDDESGDRPFKVVVVVVDDAVVLDVIVVGGDVDVVAVAPVGVATTVAVVVDVAIGASARGEPTGDLSLFDVGVCGVGSISSLSL